MVMCLVYGEASSGEKGSASGDGTSEKGGRRRGSRGKSERGRGRKGTILLLLLRLSMAFPSSSSSAERGGRRLARLSVFFVCAAAALFVLRACAPSSALFLGLRRRQEGDGGPRRRPGIGANRSRCDIFSGSWVRDDSYPLYPSSCPAIDPQFNCQLFGRPDTDYQRYRWRPNTCDLPRFDGVDFLSRMNGRTVMFVGDSLGRNQWESLICMLWAAAPATRTEMMRGEPLSTFKFLDHGVTMSYYKAPYLVDIDVVQGKRILRLNDISGNGDAWRGVDVISFNTGHWWSHRGPLQGWDYMGDGGGSFYTDMDRLVAMQKAMTTWASWVDANVDRTRTRVFFQAISPTHYNPAEWSDPVSKNCYRETTPISGWSNDGPYPDQMRVVAGVVGGMRNPAYLLDITALSELRKDGHPSIYSGDLSPDQRANPDGSADCSHWCLPGLPDTWNHLLYTALFFQF